MEMIRDWLICILSSLNILLFSFLLLNAQALTTLQAYQGPKYDHQQLDQTLRQVQEHLLAQRSPSKDYLSKESDQPPTLFIPKLNVIAPIFTATEKESPTDILQRGTLSLAPYQPPPKPQQNIIFGHSSDYLWRNNAFGTVFTLLPELQEGDLIKIFDQRKSFTYRVRKTLITAPDLGDLPEKNEQHQLILSTCYPIGFWSQRYNVIADPL